MLLELYGGEGNGMALPWNAAVPTNYFYADVDAVAETARTNPAFDTRYMLQSLHKYVLVYLENHLAIYVHESFELRPDVMGELATHLASVLDSSEALSVMGNEVFVNKALNRYGVTHGQPWKLKTISGD